MSASSLSLRTGTGKGWESGGAGNDFRKGKGRQESKVTPQMMSLSSSENVYNLKKSRERQLKLSDG